MRHECIPGHGSCRSSDLLLQIGSSAYVSFHSHRSFARRLLSRPEGPLLSGLLRHSSLSPSLTSVPLSLLRASGIFAALLPFNSVIQLHARQLVFKLSSSVFSTFFASVHGFRRTLGLLKSSEVSWRFLFHIYYYNFVPFASKGLLELVCRPNFVFGDLDTITIVTCVFAAAAENSTTLVHCSCWFRTTARGSTSSRLVTFLTLGFGGRDR